MTLKPGDVTGYCGWEVVDNSTFKDSCLLSFDTDSTYTRTGGMYLQTSGWYRIQNDTLLIGYYCEDRSSKNNCSKQGFVQTAEKKLKLVYMAGWQEKSSQVPGNYSVSKLSKCK